MPENKQHYVGLDGLRGVAVLMVFAQHYFTYPEAYHWGWIGVRIFFVLSGFLITGILYDSREAPNRYRVFYARRALRIFPLYYGVLALGWALWPMFRWELHPAWSLAPFYLTNYSRFFWLHDYITGHGLEHLKAMPHPPSWFWLYYGHFWSLSVEEQFYLVWPFVVFTVKDRKRLLWICVAVVCAVPVMRFICAYTVSNDLLEAGLLDRATPFQCDALLLGAAISLWMRGNSFRLTAIARAVVALSLTAFLAFQIIYFAVQHDMYVIDISEPIFASVGLTAINLFSAGLLLLALDSTTTWSKFLRLKWLRWLGTISYGFYVFHDIPHTFYLTLAGMFPGANSNIYGLLSGALALGGTLLLASLSYRYFETPFLRLKSRFTLQRPTIERDGQVHA